MSRDVGHANAMTIRKHVLLFAAGAAASLAMPPVGQWWVLFVALPFLLHQIEGISNGQAKRRLLAGFCAGLVFGAGYFVAALHWISFAFFVDAATYLWMMPFALGGLALILALYWGVAAAVSVMVPAWLVPRHVSLASLLAIAEWLRGHVLTGFPWAAPGLAVDGMGGIAQLASIIGMPGLTFLVMLWSFIPFVLWRQRGLPLRLRLRQHVRPALLLLCLPIAWAWGAYRLAEMPTVLRDDVALRLVQPNISQNDKWRQDNAAQIFAQLLELSGEAASGQREIVIWPESALPFFLDEEPAALQRIADRLGPERRLLTGAIRRSGVGTVNEKYFTSILLVDGMGSVRSAYDKWRLVPGGEILPFEPLLARLGFRKLVSLPESFTAGRGPAAIDVPGVGPAGALICYEIIFPHFLVSTIRPMWLVNVTNDGWFGRSAGPYQHLAQARLRALEQGLPVVRAANTGISTIIDPLGRTTASSKLAEAGVVTGRLPVAIGMTVYAGWGDWMLAFCLCVALLVSCNCPLPRQKQKH